MVFDSLSAHGGCAWATAECRDGGTAGRRGYNASGRHASGKSSGMVVSVVMQSYEM